MRKYLFVGEERSNRAIEMNVTWRDKRLCAGHLSKALDHIGIDWDECEFKNVYEDDIKEIISFNGEIIAMGRKVEKELNKYDLNFHFIFHPAARGTIRRIENYIKHVEEQLIKLKTVKI